MDKFVTKKAEAPDTIPAGLAEMTALELRRLCVAKGIRWRNAHGTGKHLPGFFERTFGSLQDEPLEREPQGELQEREPFE